VGDYHVVDTAGMAVSGPAWTMGGRTAAAAAAGMGRNASDLPGGLRPCSREELPAPMLRVNTTCLNLSLT
jgi:hypothetical protein